MNLKQIIHLKEITKVANELESQWPTLTEMILRIKLLQRAAYQNKTDIEDLIYDVQTILTDPSGTYPFKWEYHTWEWTMDGKYYNYQISFKPQAWHKVFYPCVFINGGNSDL